MKKKDLVDRVAGAAQVTERAAGTAVDAVFAAIGEAVARGEAVTVPGFGRFARNPGRRVRVGTRAPASRSPSVRRPRGPSGRERA